MLGTMVGPQGFELLPVLWWPLLLYPFKVVGTTGAGQQPDTCEGRWSASRGSELWCRCSRRGNLIDSQETCETSSGGRFEACRWDGETVTCLPKPTFADAKGHDQENGRIAKPAESSRRATGCPEPRGDGSSWLKQATNASGGHGRLTLATWNVEWLFDGIDDPTAAPKITPEQAQQRMVGVAEVLSKLQADVVHLVEVESCGVLSRVAETLGTLDGSKQLQPYLIEGHDTALRQQVGLLSVLRPTRRLSRTEAREAFPLMDSSCGVCKDGRAGNTGVSKHLVAQLQLMPGHVIEVIGLHLKAKPVDSCSCQKREAQALVVRSLVRRAIKVGHHVIVLGDLNDFDGDVPDSVGHVPTSSVLRLIKDPDGDGRLGLWNALEAIPPRERYSNRWNAGVMDPGLSLLDHILVSESLRPFVEAVGVYHGNAATQLSDHWPVWLRLNVLPLMSGILPLRQNESSLGNDTNSGGSSSSSFMQMFLFAVVPTAAALMVCALLRRTRVPAGGNIGRKRRSLQKCA